MKLNPVSFIDLTFVTDPEEIKRQLRNTVCFVHLSEKYPLVPLSEYLESTQYGFTASAKTSGKYYLLRITDIKDGKVEWDNVPFCDCEDPEKYLLNNNDILVARTGGTTGKSFLVHNVPLNSLFASYLIRLRVKKEANSEFIYTFLNSYTYWSQLIELKRGAAQPNVNAEKLKTLLIPKCSAEVQNDCISILNGKDTESEVQRKTENILKIFDDAQFLKLEQTYQLDILKKLRQQILQDAVQGKLVPQDPNDEPASVLLQKIKAEKEQLVREKKIRQEKPLPAIKPEEIPFELPESWAWCRFGEVSLTSEAGKSFKCKEVPISINEWGVIKVSAVSWDNFLEDQNKLFSTTTPNDISAQVRSGDFLISRANTTELVGKSVVVKNISKNLLLSDKTIRFKFSKFISVDYINLINNARMARKYYALMGSGSSPSMKNITRGHMLNLLVPLPPYNEQIRIIDKVEQLKTLFDDLEETIKQNQDYTRQLLQVALKEALEPK